MGRPGPPGAQLPRPSLRRPSGARDAAPTSLVAKSVRSNATASRVRRRGRACSVAVVGAYSHPGVGASSGDARVAARSAAAGKPPAGPGGAASPAARSRRSAVQTPSCSARRLWREGTGTASSRGRAAAPAPAHRATSAKTWMRTSRAAPLDGSNGAVAAMTHRSRPPGTGGRVPRRQQRGERSAHALRRAPRGRSRPRGRRPRGGRPRGRRPRGGRPRGRTPRGARPRAGDDLAGDSRRLLPRKRRTRGRRPRMRQSRPGNGRGLLEPRPRERRSLPPPARATAS